VAVNLTAAVCSGATLDDAVLPKAKLSRAVFDGAHCSRLCAPGLVGPGSSWKAAKLDDASLDAADLSSASLVGASMLRCRAARASLEAACIDCVVADFADLQDSQCRQLTMTDGSLRSVNLARAVLREATLVRVHAMEANLERVELMNATLTECDLSAVNLTEAHMQRATLQRCVLTGACLVRASLMGASFLECRFEDCSLEGVDLRDAVLSNCDFHRCALDGASLQSASLFECSFQATSIVRASLIKATVTESSLASVPSWDGVAVASSRWITCDLSGLDWRTVADHDVSSVSFTGCNLRGASFDGLQLNSVHFADCDLHGSSIRSATLVDTPLSAQDNAGDIDLTRSVLVRSSIMYPTYELLTTLAGHTESVTACSWYPLGPMLVSASGSGLYRPNADQVRVWRFSETGASHEGSTGGLSASGKPPVSCMTWSGGKALSALAVAFRPTAAHVAVATATYSVYLLDTSNNLQPILVLSGGHHHHITALAWSDDGTKLATACLDGTARVWAVSDVTPMVSSDIAAVELDRSGLTDLCLLPGTQPGMVRLVTISKSGRLMVLDDLAGGAPSQAGASARVCQTEISGTCRLTASAAGDIVAVWCLASASVLVYSPCDLVLQATIKSSTGPVRAATLCAAGKSVFMASSHGSIQVWDVASQRLQTTITGHTGDVNCLAIHAQSGLLASASVDRTVKVWRSTFCLRVSGLAAQEQTTIPEEGNDSNEGTSRNGTALS
jgi:uncharacterized protein YjbI with pentapeptide repeats